MRTHQVHHVYDQDNLKKSLRGVLTNETSQTSAALTEHIPESEGVGEEDWKSRRYPSVAESHKRTTCKACGSGDRKTGLRPAPIDLALEYGENLYERLDEISGIYVNDDDLLEEIRSLKEERTTQPSGNWIFRRAVDNTVLVDHEELPSHD